MFAGAIRDALTIHLRQRCALDRPHDDRMGGDSFRPRGRTLRADKPYVAAGERVAMSRGRSDPGGDYTKRLAKMALTQVQRIESVDSCLHTGARSSSPELRGFAWLSTPPRLRRRRLR
jgi:hypothetical protein